MRRSYKIREAKEVLDLILQDNAPLHFGDPETYTDYVISTLVHSVHGNLKTDDELIYFFEFKTRFSGKVSAYYNFA